MLKNLQLEVPSLYDTHIYITSGAKAWQLKAPLLGVVSSFYITGDTHLLQKFRVPTMKEAGAEILSVPLENSYVPVAKSIKTYSTLP